MPTEIVNLALDLMGDEPVLDIADNNVRAKSTRRWYDISRKALLRAHTWSFAKKEIILAKDIATPAFSRAFQYSWPSDALRILMDNTTDQRDFLIKGRKILTDVDTSINIEYIADIESTTLFDDLFVVAFASLIAFRSVEKITGSDKKKAGLKADMVDAINEAKRIGSIEKQSEERPEDDWVLARLSGTGIVGTRVI